MLEAHIERQGFRFIIMEKQRMLLLPKSFIESYLQDLDNEDRLEIMSVIFNWYIGIESVSINSKLVKVLFNNLLPILEGHKANYVSGSKGGAPKGNNNAKKTTETTETTETTQKTTETTPVEKINNPKEKEKEKEKEKDKDKDKDKDIISNYTSIENIFDLDMFSPEAQKLADIEFTKILNKK